jgi:hypothetical protein
MRVAFLLEAVVTLQSEPTAHALGETCSGARNLPRFLCSLLEPGPVLVVGASEVALEAAKRHDVTVVEWSAPRVEALDAEARARGLRLRVSRWDPREEPIGLPARSYRNVVCLDVLERMPDDVAALERLHRMLEPDGRLVVRVPARPWARHSDTLDGSGARRYDAESLRGALEEAGFRTLRVRHWNLVGVPSLIRERRRPTPSSASDGSRRRWWDSSLDLWYRAIERRVGFPLGVSLVGVASPELEKARARRPRYERTLGGARHRQAYEPMGAAPMSRTATR